MLELPGGVLAIILDHVWKYPDHLNLTRVCKKLCILTYQHSERFRTKLSQDLYMLLNVLESEDELDTSFSEKEKLQLYNGLSKKPTIIDTQIASTEFFIDMLTAHANSTLPEFINKHKGEMCNQYRDSKDDPTLDPDDKTLFEYACAECEQPSLPMLKKRLEKALEIKSKVTAATSIFWTSLKDSVVVQSVLPAPSAQRAQHL